MTGLKNESVIICVINKIRLKRIGYGNVVLKPAYLNVFCLKYSLNLTNAVKYSFHEVCSVLVTCLAFFILRSCIYVAPQFSLAKNIYTYIKFQLQYYIVEASRYFSWYHTIRNFFKNFFYALQLKVSVTTEPDLLSFLYILYILLSVLHCCC